MNLAILLAGTIDPKKNYVDSFFRYRNWKDSFQSITDNVITCWNSNVKTFLSVDCIEQTSIISEMIGAYKPYRTTIFSTVEGERMIERHNIGASMLKNIPGDLDFVIITRPDLRFYSSMSKWNIDFTKFNFLFREAGWWNEDYTYMEGRAPLVCDNFFAFPYKYLQHYINITDEMKSVGKLDMHDIYRFVKKHIGIENIHFVTNELMSSGPNGNIFYELVRVDENL